MNTLFNKVLGENEKRLLFLLKKKALFGQPNMWVLPQKQRKHQKNENWTRCYRILIPRAQSLRLKNLRHFMDWIQNF